MTPVPWVTLDPNLTEQVVSVLLCRVHPESVRIRASQGDGGIDVLVPVEAGKVDVYQIKYFPTALDDSRKTQIRGSLNRIRDNTSVSVRNWYLTLPLNRSQAEREWFDGITAKEGFHCEWFGLDKIESLAASHQDVIDYYLRDGRERLESAIANLRSLAGLMRPAGNQLVEPSDLTEPLTNLYQVLNRDDPHYRYDFEVGVPPPEEADRNRPNLIARVSHGTDELAVTIRVYARYRMASEDAPIPFSFQVDEEDLEPEQAEAWQSALRYGAPAEVIARNVSAGLPGGLGGDVELANIRLGPSSHHQAGPYRIRLGILDPEDQLLADAVLDMDPATQGMMGGTRASGKEQSGSFVFECLVDPPDTTERRITLNLRPRDPSGNAPAALVRGTRFLSEAHQPNRLAIGPEYGPLHENPFELPSEDAPVNTAFVELIDALAVLQNEVRGDLIVPELESFTVTTLLEVLRSAALVRGETVRDLWEEQEIEYQPSAEALDPDAPGHQLSMQGTYTLTIGDQRVELGPVVITWLAARFEIQDVEDGRRRLIARPAMGNDIRLTRRGETDDFPPEPVVPT